MSRRRYLPRRPRPSIKSDVRGDAGWRRDKARLGRPPAVVHEGRTTRLVATAVPGRRRRRA